MTAAPAMIGVDWGTSSLRAYLMDRDGRILESRVAPLGILQVEGGAFEPVLEQVCGTWLDRAPPLPILLSGMIGSRQGWVEVPYGRCPAGASEIAAALTIHLSAAGRTLRFVPGLAFRGEDGIPDVMRGEETQIIGCEAELGAAGLCLLPGTHSKWALVEAGRIGWFATFMTGELYAVLRRHSILGRMVGKEDTDEPAFERGVTLGLSADPGRGGLLKRLFSSRTLALMGDLPGDGVASYLSGLLLGAELREAMGCVAVGARSRGVLLVGSNELVGRYARALDIAGIAHRAAAPDSAARGLHRLARLAGLVEGGA